MRVTLTFNGLSVPFKLNVLILYPLKMFLGSIEIEIRAQVC